MGRVVCRHDRGRDSRETDLSYNTVSYGTALSRCDTVPTYLGLSVYVTFFFFSFSLSLLFFSFLSPCLVK